MTRKWSDIKRSKDDPARAARVAARVEAELQKERDPVFKHEQEWHDAQLDGAADDPYLTSGTPVSVSSRHSEEGLTYGAFSGTLVEDCRVGGWDVVDVRADDGSIVSVYSFSVAERSEPPILGSDLKGIRFK